MMIWYDANDDVNLEQKVRCCCILICNADLVRHGFINIEHYKLLARRNSLITSDGMS